MADVVATSTFEEGTAPVRIDCIMVYSPRHGRPPDHPSSGKKESLKYIKYHRRRRKLGLLTVIVLCLLFKLIIELTGAPKPATPPPWYNSTQTCNTNITPRCKNISTHFSGGRLSATPPTTPQPWPPERFTTPTPMPKYQICRYTY